MSHHPPFNQVEASRSDFENNLSWDQTKTPQPNWIPGQGMSNAPIPGREGFDQDLPYKTIDPSKSEPAAIYKLMIGGISPRPIAFCSSIDSKGNTNLAPFSYFNAAGHNPPIIMVSFSRGPTKNKDSCDNIKETKEFVVNIISEPFIEAANYTSIDAPPNVSEWDLTGLTPIKSETIKPAGVKESAFRMECTLEHTYDMFDPNDSSKLTGTIVLGRVHRFHIREDVLMEGGGIDPAKLLQVARMGGISYARTVRGFEIPRPRWEDEKERPEVKTALEKAKA